jgi:hypothetical protein
MTKPRKAKAGDAGQTPLPTPITSLAQFQALCEVKKTVQIEFDGRLYAVEVRRLTPAEDAILENIIGAVTPPILRGKTLEEDRPNFSDPEYLKRKAAAEVEARSLALYWCVPMFSAGRPGLANHQEITQFIQSKLNATVLNVLWQAVRNGGVTLAELVNFT